MAQKYNWQDLVTKLINFTYCPIDQLVNLDGFDRLGTDIPFKLALKRVPFAVGEKGAQATFKVFHKMYEPFIKESMEAKNNQQGNYEVFTVTPRCLDVLVGNQDNQQINDDNTGDDISCQGCKADVDIKDEKGKIIIKVHSQIVGFYSKVLTNSIISISI